MKFPFFQSLAARLMLSHLIVGAVSVGLVASIAGHFIMESGRREVENNLEEVAFILSNDLESSFNQVVTNESIDFTTIQAVLKKDLANRPNVHYTIYSYDGSPIISNESHLEVVYPPLPEINSALKNVESEAVRNNKLGQETHYIVVPISHNLIVYGVLRVDAVYDQNMGPTLRSLYLLWLISGLLLLGVAIGSWWFSHSVTASLEGLNDVAEQLSKGDLQARIEPQGPMEMRRFGQTLNQMANHLQDNINGMKAFVANASHELRTPLTAIKLHVDALADGAVAEPQVAQRFLSQLQDEIDRMNRTITDLLDLSKIEANRGQIKLEEVDLGQILSETRDLWRARSEQAGIELKLNLPQIIPKILGNEDQLRRLFDNLLDNAIKHAPLGGWVELDLINLSKRQIMRVEVRDNGKGILPEHLPRIFERFYRVEAPYEEKTSGSGLGLAIAKSIVESHEGKIGVTSQMNEGSTFWVELNIPG
jgi:signal transduction histidine kinase